MFHHHVEENVGKEKEATPSTIDIKFNYPQTSAFPSHYFVQQSQLLPFKRFQSIQRRRERRGGGEGESSNLRPFHLHARSPLHHRSTTFSLLFALERRIHESFHVRAFQEEAFTDLLFSNTPERGRGRELGTSNSLLCSRFQSVSMHRLCHRPISFFPLLLLLLLPRFYRRQTIFRTGEVSTVFLFFFSLSLILLENSRKEREREWRLFERIFFNKNFVYFFFEIVKKILEIL